MYQIEKKAYAKINLHLDVLSRYPDGYHEVFTVMQSLSLCDDLKITLDDTFDGIKVVCDEADVPTDDKNIVCRAAKNFFDELGRDIDKGIKIEIKKRIPVSAGLGGGSADAAAVLCALNELFGMPISINRILEIGGAIGADVPFCMTGGCVFANGKGDVLHELKPMPDCFVVVARGGEGISTPLAYASLDKKYNDFLPDSYIPQNAATLLTAIADNDLKGICKNLYNVFEDAIFPDRPIAKAIKESLVENGAYGALMSGSGTAVFAIFESLDLAENAAEKIKELGYFATVAEPTNKI